MPNSVLLDVVLRAADDREFQEQLVADPDAVGRIYRLGREEQRVNRGMADYSFVPGRRTAFDRVAFADLLALFMKLAINDALNDPDVYGALQGITQKLTERGNDQEAQRLKQIAEARAAEAKGKACAQSLNALVNAILMVMVIVLLELLFGTPHDPPE